MTLCGGPRHDCHATRLLLREFTKASQSWASAPPAQNGRISNDVGIQGSRESAPVQLPVPLELPRMSKTKVLIVEDYRPLAETLEYQLQRAGYEVSRAADGR